MPLGRKTGGRKKGTPNKTPAAKREAILNSGAETPLDYMLRIMRDKDADTDRRDDMAKAAAPYLHAKLATIAHTGEDGTGPVHHAVEVHIVDHRPAKD